MESELHWSRGCGSGGVGHSGHKNVADYRIGVKVGNWYEDRCGDDLVTHSRHHLGFGEPFEGGSVTREAYTADGKTGEALAAAYRREDLCKREQCVPRHLKLEHRDPAEPTQQHLATVTQLSYGAGSEGGAPSKPQAFVWNGQNKHDTRIHDIPGSSTRATQRQQAAQAEEQQDPYLSSAKAALLQAALTTDITTGMPSAGRLAHSGKADGPFGQPSSKAIGRKATGASVSELDKNYHKLGLRK